MVMVELKGDEQGKFYICLLVRLFVCLFVSKLLLSLIFVLWQSPFNVTFICLSMSGRNVIFFLLVISMERSFSNLDFQVIMKIPSCNVINYIIFFPSFINHFHLNIQCVELLIIYQYKTIS